MPIFKHTLIRMTGDKHKWILDTKVIFKVLWFKPGFHLFRIFAGSVLRCKCKLAQKSGKRSTKHHQKRSCVLFLIFVMRKTIHIYTIQESGNLSLVPEPKSFLNFCLRIYIHKPSLNPRILLTEAAIQNLTRLSLYLRIHLRFDLNGHGRLVLAEGGEGGAGLAVLWGVQGPCCHLHHNINHWYYILKGLVALPLFLFTLSFLIHS